jgi:hypothetical protein
MLNLAVLDPVSLFRLGPEPLDAASRIHSTTLQLEAPKQRSVELSP